MSKAKGVVWDLAGLYAKKDLGRIECDIEAAIASAKDFKATYYGKIVAPECTSAILLKALQTYEQLIEQVYRPYAMASLLFSGDGRSDEYKALIAKVQDAVTRVNNEVLFFTLEIQKISDEKVQEFYENAELAHYRHYLESQRVFTPFMLDETEEQIINRKDLTGKTALVNLFDEFTAAFEWQFELNGSTKTMTESEIRELFRDPDAEVRRRAKIAHDQKYGENALIFTNVFGNLIKDHATEMEMRGYSSPIAPTHLGNKVPPEVVDTMLQVTEENFTLVQQYYELKARMLNIPEVKGSDLYAPVTESERVIPFEEGRGMVLASFTSFSPEFGELMGRVFSERWIDAEIRPGKRGGAFCFSVAPSVHPYVLMNYVDNLNSVYTMAHELGHALHTVLSSEKETLLTFHPPLILAETASVFAEMLLTRNLLAHDLDHATRVQILASKLEDFFATISRQTMYIRFELEAHLKGATARLSADDFCELWNKHRSALYGDSVQFWPEEKWYWAVIPHFIHTRFYCYAYTFGALFVLALYSRYLRDGKSFVPRYRELLAAGDSIMPAKLLSRLDMDFSQASFWQGGFEVIRNMLEELNALVSNEVVSKQDAYEHDSSKLQI